MTGRAQEPGERDHPRRRRGDGRDLAELEHPLQAMDIEHLDRQGDRAGVIDAGGAVAAGEPEQRIDAPHARPRQGTVQERCREAPDGRAGARRLLLQRRDIAQRIEAALCGIVGRINRAAPRRLTRMRFDQQPPLVEADELLIGPRREAIADVSMRQRIERLGDDGELIARNLRFAPQRDVVGRGGCGE